MGAEVFALVGGVEFELFSVLKEETAALAAVLVKLA